MASRTVNMKGGKVMPLVGFGTWNIIPFESKNAVYEALNAGYRRIDCSCDSQNLKEVGEGIAQAINDGFVMSSDLFVTGQLKDPVPEEVEPRLVDALNQLQIQHLDLFMIHWAGDLSASNIQSWAAMETVLGQGLVRVIGVSNLTVQKLGEMLPVVNVLPMVGLGEMHPLCRQDELLAYCQSEDIHWIACAVFGAGEMAAPTEHMRLSAHYNLLKNENILSVAITSDKTPAQVLIRWALQRGTSVTVNTTNTSRMKEYIDVFDWELNVEQFQLLSTLEPQSCLLSGDFEIVPMSTRVDEQEANV